MARLTAAAFDKNKGSKAKDTMALAAFLNARQPKREPTQFERFQAEVKVPPRPTFGQSVERVMDDITAAGVGVNKAVAGAPGVLGDIGSLWGMGMDALDVDEASGWRTPGTVLADNFWNSDDTIGMWEDLTGKLPEPKGKKGQAIALAAELFLPTPGGKKKLVTLQDVAKAKGISPVDLANNYTSLRYGARRGPTDTPPEEWSKTVVEQPHAPMQKRRLEDYLGKTLTMTPADIATIDQVAAINGKDLVSVLKPGGGPRYNLTPENVDKAWAGSPGTAQKEINRMKKLEQEGHDPIMAATTMRVDGVDYNSSVADAILQQLQTGKFTGKQLTKLNDYLFTGLQRELKDKFKPELFPGIGSQKAIENSRRYLLDNSAGPHGKVRAAMAKVLDARGGRELGAPEVGPIRFAVTDDEFALYPAQHVGTSLFQIDPSGAPIPSDHGTYAAGYPKKADSTSGRLETLVPGGILFDDWATGKGITLNDKGQMSSNDLKGFNMGGVTQKITPKLLDKLWKMGYR